MEALPVRFYFFAAIVQVAGHWHSNLATTNAINIRTAGHSGRSLDNRRTGWCGMFADQRATALCLYPLFSPSITPCCTFRARDVCPEQVVVDDIKALLAGRPLPYKGFDMFEGEDHNIRGQIQIDG